MISFWNVHTLLDDATEGHKMLAFFNLASNFSDIHLGSRRTELL